MSAAIILPLTASEMQALEKIGKAERVSVDGLIARFVREKLAEYAPLIPSLG